jgi:hypothetical protein
MARIRTIKPEFWASEQVMDCKPITRLLFIGLWNFVDDFGRAPVAPRTIKAQVMPGDSCSGSDIQDMLNELSAVGLIRFYTADEKMFFEITGWSKHQKIDNPSKYKVCPAPSDDQSQIVAIPSEESKQIGLEGRGKEEEKKKDTCAVVKPTRTDEKFEEFWKSLPKRDGANPKEPARRLFEAAVKSGEDPEAIIAGARQCARAESKNAGTPYIPQAVKWLRDKRWRDYGQQIAEQGAPFDWEAVVKLKATIGVWSKHAGPEPGAVGCRAPAEILQKYGLAS